MTPTRIAVVGAGQIGRAHIEAIGRDASLSLCAIADPSVEARALAQTLGVPAFNEIGAMLAAVQPDGVVVASPNALHLSHAQSLIVAGVPILLEKPITASLAEGKQLLALLSEHPVAVLVGHHRAHSPIMKAASDVVASGVLGRVVAISGSATFYKPDPYFVDGAWRTRKGGGPILLNMIHEIHNLRLLCGEIADVQSIVSHAIRGFEVEDTAAINFRFHGGAIGSFILSDAASSPRSWEQTSHENKAYPTYPDENCYVISGTRGTLHVPTMKLQTTPIDKPSSWWTPLDSAIVPVEREDPLTLQMQHFGSVVRGEATPRVSALDGVENLRVVAAIVQSAETNATVSLASLSMH